MSPSAENKQLEGPSPSMCKGLKQAIVLKVNLYQSIARIKQRPPGIVLIVKPPMIASFHFGTIRDTLIRG